MIQPHGKCCQHSPEAGRVKEHILHNSLWRSMVLTILWFQLMIMISDFCLPDLWESNFLWWGLPGWHSGEESACQCRRHQRYQFNPWVKKIPWSRRWQPTPVYLPGKFHRQRSLAGHSPWGHKESDMTGWAHARAHTHTFLLYFKPTNLWWFVSAGFLTICMTVQLLWCCLRNNGWLSYFCSDYEGRERNGLLGFSK